MTIDLTSPAALLAITPAQATRLFPGGSVAIQKAWKALAKHWHPDRHVDAVTAKTVFQHLGQLQDAALQAVAPARFERLSGAAITIEPIRRGSFELGETFICEERIVTFLDDAFVSIARTGLAMAKLLTFDNAAMSRQFAPCLPVIEYTYDVDGGMLVSVHRDPRYVRLADVMIHVGGTLPARHAAWIISGLENIACYLRSRDLVHGAIDTSAVFIDCEAHRVALLGGWWFATREGFPLRALPARSARCLPSLVSEIGIATAAIDLELIRQTAREMLGYAPGAVAAGGAIPPALVDWLASPPEETAFADYAAWERVLRASFGAPAFADFGVTHTDIYPL